MKTPVLESLFGRVACRRFLVNVAKTLRTPIFKNICERQLLNHYPKNIDTVSQKVANKQLEK